MGNIRVTVFGGTGFIGRHLLARLGACGARVTCPSAGRLPSTLEEGPVSDEDQTPLSHRGNGAPDPTFAGLKSRIAASH
jgi:nucleoside-diphosphate-sugar epimerase